MKLNQELDLEIKIFTNVRFNSEENLKFYSELKQLLKKACKNEIPTGFFI